VKNQNNSLKQHLEYAKTQVETWPEWKKQVLETRESNSQKRMQLESSNQKLSIT
jgi:hypothetical protein